MDVMKKVPVREQAPDVRNKNFDEVCLGYNAEEAQVYRDVQYQSIFRNSYIM